MDDAYFIRKTRKEKRLLHRRITATDDGDVLAAKEEPITGGAR